MRKSTNANPLWVPAPENFWGSLNVFISPNVLQANTIQPMLSFKYGFSLLIAGTFLIISFWKFHNKRQFQTFQHWSNGHRIYYDIKITPQNYRRTQIKHSKAKKGHGWTKLERIKLDCIWVNLKNVGPSFFKFISVFMKMSFAQLENHSQLLCGRDFANKRLLLC